VKFNKKVKNYIDANDDLLITYNAAYIIVVTIIGLPRLVSLNDYFVRSQSSLG
jgi:hypothetical protein